MQDFLQAGFESLEQLAQASDDELLQIPGFNLDKVSDLRAAINLLRPSKEKKEEEETEENPSSS
jgi:N utilization substance protein A